MNSGDVRLLLLAVAAGVLGIAAGVWFQASGQRTAPRQSAAQAAPQAPATPPAAGMKAAQPGDPLPALTLPALDGRQVELRTLGQGRPLLINVWASWCRPCIQEMPELDRFAAAEGAKGVQVLGLALDTPEGVRDFLKRIPVRYPVVLELPGPADASVRLGNRGGVLPYTVLISQDGRLLKQKVGPFARGEIDSWVAEAGARQIQTRD